MKTVILCRFWRTFPLLFAYAVFSIANSMWAGEAPALRVGNKVESVSPRWYSRTVYLVRHGAYNQGENGDEAIVNGLTPLGIAQARLTGDRFRGMPLTFSKLASSTFTRARQTAAVIGQAFPLLVAKTDPLLCECQPPTFSAEIDHDVPEEELAASEKQLNKAFAEYFVPAKDHDESDIIVAHGNVIRWFVCKALGVDTKAWLGLSVAHCSLTIIQVTPSGTFKVLGVGDVGHIPPNLQSGITRTNPELQAP